MVCDERVIALNNAGVACFENGDYLNARSLFLQAISGQRAAGTNFATPSTNTAYTTSNVSVTEPLRSSLAHESGTNKQNNEFDEGMDGGYNQAERLGSDEHPVVLETVLLFNVAQAKRMEQDTEEARTFYHDAIEVIIRHTVTPSTECVKGNRINAALLSLRQPVWALARTIHRIVIPALHNIALLAYRAGNYSEGVAYYEIALTHGQALFGLQGMCVGVTLNCLGVTYYQQATAANVDRSQVSQPPEVASLWDTSIKYLSEALQILLVCAGPNSTVVASTCNNLGRAFIQRNDLSSALLYFSQALEIRRDTLGVDSIDFAISAFNTGQALQRLGEFDAAIALYQEFQNSLVKLANWNRDVAICLSLVAQLYQERHEYALAQTVYEESLAIARAVLGNIHYDVAFLLRQIGKFYFERDDLDRALEVFEEGLCVEKAVLSVSHPSLIVTTVNIGEVYRKMGDFDRALEWYTEAMSLQKVRFGGCCVEVAEALDVIAIIHCQKGDSHVGLTCLQDALVVRRALFGDDHVNVSKSLLDVGAVLCQLGMMHDAIQTFTEALRISKLHRGNGQEAGCILHNIGICYQRQGTYEHAIACFNETLRIEASTVEDYHSYVAYTLFELGKTYNMDNDPDRALVYFQQAVSMEQRLPPSNSVALCGAACIAIGNIFLAKSDLAPMMEAFAMATRLLSSTGRQFAPTDVSSELLNLYASRFATAAPAA